MQRFFVHANGRTIWRLRRAVDVPRYFFDLWHAECAYGSTWPKQLYRFGQLVLRTTRLQGCRQHPARGLASARCATDREAGRPLYSKIDAVYATLFTNSLLTETLETTVSKELGQERHMRDGSEGQPGPSCWNSLFGDRGHCELHAGLTR